MHERLPTTGVPIVVFHSYNDSVVKCLIPAAGRLTITLGVGEKGIICKGVNYNYENEGRSVKLIFSAFFLLVIFFCSSMEWHDIKDK